MTLSEQILTRGMQQGRYLEKLETARELLQDGMMAKKISKITKLNLDEILREAEHLATNK